MRTRTGADRGVFAARLVWAVASLPQGICGEKPLAPPRDRVVIQVPESGVMCEAELADVKEGAFALSRGRIALSRGQAFEAVKLGDAVACGGV